MCNLSLQADHFEDYVFGLFAFIVRRKNKDETDKSRREDGEERRGGPAQDIVKSKRTRNAAWTQLLLRWEHLKDGFYLQMQMVQLKLHFCLCINGLRQLWNQHT